MIKYSIIVCSYNRYEFLKATIDSILEVIENRNDFEILIIDNNSKDQTVNIKQEYLGNNHVKYFLELKQGLSHARNRGLNEALGDILIYLDDDIELVSNYFKTCDAIFANKDIIISGGKVLPHKINIPAWLPLKYYHLVSVFDLGDQPKFVTCIMGGNFAIRRIDALKIGLYDTALGRNGKKLGGGEEVDYQNRARLMGYKIYYDPKQNILHKINEKLNENYILNYSKELGRSERIIDSSISKFKTLKKIVKSIAALGLFCSLRHLVKQEKRITYLKIINNYAIGYLGFK
ncbi:glycosyltransferase family 2 protein [Flavobacterium mesophilum]|uniref:glycosyltransferase family 2 protein n=1 Tax=Flavobacterium mesophilum TaxID=3143495 RepID=UPI0031DBDEC3